MRKSIGNWNAHFAGFSVREKDECKGEQIFSSSNLTYYENHQAY